MKWMVKDIMAQTDRQTDRRNSSIELLRIIAILIIITHHFGYHGIFHSNDSVYNVLTVDNLSFQVMFTQVVSWGGWLGNAIFVIITGYFMVNSSLNIRKIFKLLIIMFFYAWMIDFFVLISGLMAPSFVEIMKASLPIWFGKNWFVSCYIIFSFFIPFINVFLKTLDEVKYRKFIIGMYFLWSLLPALKMTTFTNTSALIFFLFMYSIGAYIRLYSEKIIRTELHVLYRRNFVLLLIFMLSSICIMDGLGVCFHKDVFIGNAYMLINIFQIPLATLMFLCFVSLPPFYNKTINVLGGAVLGVYLIHDNDFVREVIWQRLFPNIEYITSDMYVIIYIVKVIGIFVICSFIELLRKRYMDTLFNSLVDYLLLRLKNC